MIKGTHAELYCCENISNIENYALAINDKVNVCDCHHKAEITENGTTSVEELMSSGLYYNRPASELVFLRHDEHARLHGFNMSAEKREVLRKSNLGRKNPNAVAAMRKANTGRIQSEETRRKISAHKKGQRTWLGRHHSDETRKKLSETSIGKHWYNNGEVEVHMFNCPDGFVPGRLKRKH